MLPSSGYFKNLSCPYFSNGLCNRPFCHYSHTPKVEYKPTSLTKSIPEYNPTPIAGLQRDKIRDEILQVTKSRSTCPSSPSFSSSSKSFSSPKVTSASAKASLSTKKQPPKLHSIDFIDLEGPSESKALERNSKQAIKAEVSSKSDEKIRRVSSISESNESDSLKKLKSSVHSLSQRNNKKEIVSSSKITSGTTPFSRPAKSSRKSVDNDDHDVIEVLDTTPDSSDSGEPLFASKKPRIAHKSDHERISKTPTAPSKKVTPTQVMFDRFKKLSDHVKSSPPLASDDDDPPVKKRVAHSIKLNVPSRKSASKAGHPSSSNITKKRPTIPADYSKKIPLAIRTKYLNLLIDELLKFCPEEEAYSRGLEEEKDIHNRGSSKNVYINIAANTVRQIRNEASSKAKNNSSRNGNSLEDKLALANRKVSHQKILDGPHAENCSIEKRGRFLTIDDLTELQLYQQMKRYIMTPELLEEYGYPRSDPNEYGSVILPPSDLKKKNNFSSTRRICYRCMKSFQVDKNGYPAHSEACVYHSGRLWNERFNRSMERKYSCCKGDPSSGGCCAGKSHVVDGSFHPLFTKGYVTTLPPWKPEKFAGIYSLDCEMCYTTIGLELTRVSIINHKIECVYESFVKPENPILDYNTKFSGIKEGDLDSVTTTLKDVQKKILSMVNSKTILIGHSLESDLKALKIVHETIIDTAQVFPHRRGLPYKRALRTLMSECLFSIIQDDEEGHDSQEDAKSCMKLMLWKVSQDLKVVRV